MATSNSTNWTRTKQDIIKMALFHIGKYGNGRTIEAEDYNIVGSILNDMIKEWEPDLHLWTKQEGILHLTPYVGEYDLGNYAYFTERNDQITQRVSTDYIAGDTVLVLDSTAGMATTYNIGVVLDTGYTFWTTVSNINADGVTLTLTDALPSAVAQSNLVYYFTVAAAKPLRVLSARLLSGFDGGEIQDLVALPMSVIAYEDYWNLVGTSLNGQNPNQYAYNPKTTSGTLYIWPRPTSTAYRMQLTYERILEDVDSINDNFDFPAEWFGALQYQLAVRIAPGYGKSERLATLMPMASSMLQNAKDKDNELAYVKFSPDLGGYY